MKLCFFIFFFIFFLIFEKTLSFQCNKLKLNFPYVFSTKTNYNNSLSFYDVKDLLDLSFVPNNCEIEKLFFISRHSTRNPDIRKIPSYNLLVDFLKENILKNEDQFECKNLLSQVKNYTFKYKYEEQNDIVPIGDEITSSMGERFYQKFKQILIKDLKVGVSTDLRTYQTFINFFKGFENKSSEYDPVILKSLKLHFFEKKKIIKNDNPFLKSYLQSEIYKNLEKSIAKRLKLNETQLNWHKIKSIFEICSFDFNIYNDTTWCNFISEKEFEIIDFIIDAKNFYDYYLSGNSKNKQTILFFKQLMSFLNENKENVFLGFSHSSIIKSLISQLEMFKKGFVLNLDLEDSMAKSKHREWKLSKILPFNTNLSFLKYNCNNKLKILALYQEKPVFLNDCDNILCDYDLFLKKIEKLY